jgi:diaminopimelate epimerase
MRFTKMHGLGNDYIYVNGFEEPVHDAPALARAMSDRHTAVGSDGLILICPSQVADVRMEMYNADGSRGPMCGNGIRCVAKYAYDHGLLADSSLGCRLEDPSVMPLLTALAASVGRRASPSQIAARCVAMNIETDSGVLRAVAWCPDDSAQRVCADVGRPSVAPDDIPSTLPGESIVEHPIKAAGRRLAVTCVSVGSAHAVIFTDNLEAADLSAVGPALEHHPVFPNRINVHFAHAKTRRLLAVRHWERGSGPTRACGTGACAVCVAGSLAGRSDRTVEVRMPGGSADIHWDLNGHVYMTGPAVEVFSGEWPDSAT